MNRNNNTIEVNKSDLNNLVEYIHTLLDFIDVDEFEDEENVSLVRDGYDNFVAPISDLIR